MFCDRKSKAVSISMKQQFCKTEMKDFNSFVLLQYVSIMKYHYYWHAFLHSKERILTGKIHQILNY